MADELATLLSNKAGAGRAGGADLRRPRLDRHAARPTSTALPRPASQCANSTRSIRWSGRATGASITAITASCWWSTRRSPSPAASTSAAPTRRARSAASRPSDADALKEGWRDTHIELRGPARAGVRAQLRADLVGSGLPGSTRQGTATDGDRAGSRVVKVLESDPQRPAQPHLCVAAGCHRGLAAQRLADDGLLRAGRRNDRRRWSMRHGVASTCSWCCPGAAISSSCCRPGRSYYDRLLAAGVRIHGMDDAVMHAKTAVIDGVFSTVGSSNMDWRSFVANNEINAIVVGRDFGQQLEAVFQRDLANSRPIELDAWRQRGLDDRFMEQIRASRRAVSLAEHRPGLGSAACPILIGPSPGTSDCVRHRCIAPAPLCAHHRALRSPAACGLV